MKLINKILLMALPLALFGCGDDGGDDEPSVATITLTSSDPAKGATDVDKGIKTIALTFSGEVDFVSGKAADFDGTSVGIADFSKRANVMTFTIPKTLDAGTTYTLSIPQGFFAAHGTSTEVPAVTVSFSTKAKKAVAVAESPVTPGASAEAVALYDYLVSVYGQKTLSSTIANVNWNLDEAEMVYKATGKYPAIATVDYLHFYTLYDDKNRNPYKGGWKVNYDDITELKAWSDAGGIVSACWHWNVPNKEAEKYTTSSYTCTPGDGSKDSDGNMTTVFSPKNIFTEGTWEQKIADEDLALIASLLKKFQEAGIAVIWRPLHEASGNANSGGTAWFWWGIDGADTYVKLWRKMFDYFKEQGLNNLIWVWTTQTGFGYETSKGVLGDSDWYPGDEYVDIIGRDEYTKTTAQSHEEFDAITEAFPGKMVTLAECGSVSKISEQWEAGARWSWFMPWYDYDADNKAKSLDNHTYANTEWWKDAMSCENVITRDQLPKLK